MLEISLILQFIIVEAYLIVHDQESSIYLSNPTGVHSLRLEILTTWKLVYMFLFLDQLPKFCFHQKNINVVALEMLCKWLHNTPFIFTLKQYLLQFSSYPFHDPTHSAMKIECALSWFLVYLPSIRALNATLGQYY